MHLVITYRYLIFIQINPHYSTLFCKIIELLSFPPVIIAFKGKQICPVCVEITANDGRSISPYVFL